MTRYYNHRGKIVRVEEDYSGDVARLRMATYSYGYEPPRDDYMTVTIDDLPMHGIWQDMRELLQRGQALIDRRCRA